jgi:hypothetical protein
MEAVYLKYLKTFIILHDVTSEKIKFFKLRIIYIIYFKNHGNDVLDNIKEDSWGSE